MPPVTAGVGAGGSVRAAVGPAYRPPMPAVEPTFPPPTARLVFRSWQEDDLDAALSLWGDPAVTAFFSAGGAWSREQVLARLQAEIDTERRCGVQYWPVFLRDGGDLVGCCGLRPRDSAHGVWELGVHLRPVFWGQGLAGEAARAVIGFAFGQFGAAALFAGHHPGNDASRRLMARLGFRHTHDEPYAPTGAQHPSYLLPAADWPRVGSADATEGGVT